MLEMTKTFGDQVSTQAIVTDIFYIIPTAASFLVILALGLIDGGMVNAKHLIDTFAQKLISAYVSGVASLVAGYGIWNWQFYQALGDPKALGHSISDWWILGPYMRTYAQFIDPSILPGADSQQILAVFFFAYAVVIGAFVHSIGVGRMKPSACYIMSALAGGLVMPILSYLTWGPVGPLTNRGLHDFVGAYSLYMLIGVWSLIFSWRLGPRHSSTTSFNGFMVAAGALILMLAIPLFVIGCGLIQPGVGYLGASNTTSGLGIVFINVFMALSGGVFAGALIAYRKRRPVYVFTGPIAGYVICTALFDVAAPWQCFGLALVAPYIALLGAAAMARLNIDDEKIVPLAFGPAIVSALMAGIIGAGLPTGGMPGLKGAYAYQHAHINLGMQFIGVLVTLVISAGFGLIVVLTIEKTLGIRVASEVEEGGLDNFYWRG